MLIENAGQLYAVAFVGLLFIGGPLAIGIGCIIQHRSKRRAKSWRRYGRG